jgi:hypothetical protein
MNASEMAEAAETHLQTDKVELDISLARTETAPSLLVAKEIFGSVYSLRRNYDKPKDLQQV